MDREAGEVIVLEAPTAPAKLSVGVLGAGAIAQQLHVPVLMSMPQVAVSWIADVNESRAKALADVNQVVGIGVTDPRSLPHADVVLVAIPPGVRAAYFQEFSRRGTALLVEKPFALSLEEHGYYTSQFPAHALGCGYQRRMYGSTQLLRTVVRERWFGRLMGFTVLEGGRTSKTGLGSSYIDDKRISGGGVLASLACHAIDSAFFVTGATEFDVLACEFVMDGDIDRKVSAKLLLKGGQVKAACPFEITVSWLDQQENTVTLEFENAFVRCGMQPTMSAQVRGKRDGAEWVTLAHSGAGAATAYQACFLEWAEFLAGVSAGQPSVMAASTAVATTSAIEQMYGMSGNA